MIVYDKQSDVPEGTRLTVLMFSSPTCPACPGALANLKEAKVPEGVAGVKVNVEEDYELAEQYHVMSLPTFILLRGRYPIAQMNGAQPVQALEDRIETILL